jgi:hypothetical protein
VTFEVDHVFEQAERVEKLLREARAGGDAAGEDGHDDGDEDEEGARDE